MNKRIFVVAAAAVTLYATLPAASSAESVLRVAMTAADIPDWTGQPSQAFEGYRFVAWNLYDALINWDLTDPKKAATIRPGLALSWKMDDKDRRKWVFRLREDVKFHDGCAWNSEVARWNLVRLTDKAAPQFNATQFARARKSTENIERVDAPRPDVLEIHTRRPDPNFHYNMAYVLMISKCQVENLKNDYEAYARQPSGTGPYRFGSVTPRQRLELTRNADYWDRTRIPKHDKLVLLPMPEATSRVAALMSGQVDFIENPPPDTLARLRSAGMQLFTNAYPHNWDYLLNHQKGAFNDVRVRQAANYAVNKEDIVSLMGNTAMAGYATLTPSQPHYGNPFKYEFNLPRARQLLKEAGCSPCRIRVGVAPSGSGQMQPIPMNELVKAQLEAAGFQVSLQTMDWNTLVTLFIKGWQAAPELDAINVSLPTSDPVTALISTYTTAARSPAGWNWGWYTNEKVDRLAEEIQKSNDPARIDQLFTQIHEAVNEDAARVFIVHDLGPRALSPKLSGFVQAQSWFQDLTPIVVGR